MRKTLFLVCALAVFMCSECSIIGNIDTHSCVFDTDELKSFLPQIQGAEEHIICHEEGVSGGEDKNEIPQYLTVRSKKHNMAIFSAAKVDPNDKGDKEGRGDWTIKVSDWHRVTQRPKIDDYQVFSDFEKGHLFARRYSNNQNQAKATMRIANAVPQDKVFNEIVWSVAEEHLQKEFIDKCNTEENQFSVVVTGAVPGYYGKDEIVSENGEINLRIGKTDSRNRFYEPAPQKKFQPDPNIYNLEMKDLLTVPTHMWTYAICLSKTDESDELTVVNHASFIGLNYRTGVVKWYRKFSDFLKTLKVMYDSYAKPPPSVSIPAATQDSRLMTQDSNLPLEPLTKKVKMCGHNAVLRPVTMLCTKRDGVSEVDFWENINLNKLRKRNERRRLNHLLSVYGVKFITIDDESHDIIQVDGNSVVGGGDKKPKRGKKRKTVVGGGDKKPKRGKKRKNEEKRRKRSIQGNSTQAEPDILFTTVIIHDMDPDSNFDISECKIREKSPDGEIKETHTYNFKKNTIIEDKKPGGSVLTAKYFVNGTEVEATKEVSTDTEINIVLRPRGNPLAPANTTTTPDTTAPTTTRRGQGG